MFVVRPIGGVETRMMKCVTYVLVEIIVNANQVAQDP